jgi:hypothetical protein
MLKKLSSRVAYQNRWMTLRVVEIERADGSKGIYGVVEVANPTRVPLSDVVIAVRYADSQGAVRETGRRVNQLPPGQATRFATGLGPFTSPQQFEVGVTSARVARND